MLVELAPVTSTVGLSSQPLNGSPIYGTSIRSKRVSDWSIREAACRLVSEGSVLSG